jgi:hypothetical protein
MKKTSRVFELMSLLAFAAAVNLTSGEAMAFNKKGKNPATKAKHLSAGKFQKKAAAKSKSGKTSAGKSKFGAGSKTVTGEKKIETGEKLGREFVFDGSTVSGNYHAAGGAVARVEQEKEMIDLIGLRHDFKDRLQAERERLRNGQSASAEQGGEL